MKLIVDRTQRKAKMRAHTATHLLHYFLDKRLGWTKQAWSVVDNDILRFDFATKSPLSEEDITSIEKEINTIIAQWITVSVKEMSLEEAKKTGAKAFFEDKYWETVRVVTIGDMWSVELCWGTHVTSTDELWGFIIESQDAVSSWVRRISAYTWMKVAEYAMNLKQEKINFAKRLDGTPKQIDEKLTKLLKQKELLQTENESLQASMIWWMLKDMITNNSTKSETFEYVLNIWWTTLESQPFKTIVQHMKQTYPENIRVVYSPQWNFALYSWNKAISVKQIAREQSLKWWWSDQFVQWKDQNVVEIFWK